MKRPLADLWRDFRSNITKGVDRVFKVGKLPPCQLYKSFHKVDLSTGDISYRPILVYNQIKLRLISFPTQSLRWVRKFAQWFVSFFSYHLEDNGNAQPAQRDIHKILFQLSHTGAIYYISPISLRETADTNKDDPGRMSSLKSSHFDVRVGGGGNLSMGGKLM